MSDPDIDLDNRNPLGGLDSLATGAALAVVAVIPTLMACILTPWKLVSMLNDAPNLGRRGLLLAPGAYFVLALATILIFVGFTASESTIARDGSLIGPGFARGVSDAASEGNVWKTLSRIAPIFIFAIFLGVIGRGLTRWAGSWWSLRTSLRASFYIVATFLSCIILLGAFFEWVGVLIENRALAHSLYSMSGVPNIILPVWMYAAFFKFGGGISWSRALVLAVAIFVMLILCVLIIGLPSLM